MVHEKWHMPWIKIVIYTIMVFLGLIALVPVYLVLVNVTRSTVEIQSGLSLLPSVHLADNWRVLNMTNLSLPRGYFNSGYMAFLSAVCVMYFSAMAAYGIFMYHFRFRRAVWGLILFVMFLPASLSYIGFHQAVSTMGLLNSHIPLILPGIATPTAVFFLRQYLMTLPAKELADVARIDGAGELWTFNAIVLPIMKPALATQGFFAFVGSWNNFFMPFILITDWKLFTLPMMVALLQTEIHNVDFGSVYLGLGVSFLPILLVYTFFSRFIISGLTMGSLKE